MGKDGRAHGATGCGLDLQRQFGRTLLAAADLRQPTLGHANGSGEVSGFVSRLVEIGVERHGTND